MCTALQQYKRQWFVTSIEALLSNSLANDYNGASIMSVCVCIPVCVSSLCALSPHWQAM